jgi:hypothetical protein
VDGTRGGLADQEARVVLGEDDHAGAGLGRLVEALRRRGPDLDPRLQDPLQVPHGQGRIVDRREAPLRELDPLLVEQRVREGPREEVGHRLRGMLREAEVERLVEAAVDVRDLDLEVVHRRR